MVNHQIKVHMVITEPQRWLHEPYIEANFMALRQDAVPQIT